MQGEQKKYYSIRASSRSVSEPERSDSKAVVQVGDTVTRRPVTFLAAERAASAVLCGKVIWVHPLGRFHTVEFGEGEQAVRESFMGVER